MTSSWSGLPIAPTGPSRVPSTALAQRPQPAGQPMSRDQQVAADPAAAAVAVAEAAERNGLDVGALQVAREAYGKALELPEHRSQEVQRKLAKKRALERLQQLGTSDRDLLGVLAEALRGMARTVPSRADQARLATEMGVSGGEALRTIFDPCLARARRSVTTDENDPE